MTARDGMATELYRYGREAFQAERMGEAIEYLRASAALCPHFKTVELLGSALMISKQYAEAAIFLAAFAGLAPAQSGARVLLSQTLIVLGDQRLARIQLGEVVRINPDHKKAREILTQLPPDPDAGS